VRRDAHRAQPLELGQLRCHLARQVHLLDAQRRELPMTIATLRCCSSPDDSKRVGHRRTRVGLDGALGVARLERLRLGLGLLQLRLDSSRFMTPACSSSASAAIVSSSCSFIATSSISCGSCADHSSSVRALAALRRDQLLETSALSCSIAGCGCPALTCQPSTACAPEIKTA